MESPASVWPEAPSRHLRPRLGLQPPGGLELRVSLVPQMILQEKPAVPTPRSRPEVRLRLPVSPLNTPMVAFLPFPLCAPLGKLHLRVECLQWLQNRARHVTGIYWGRALIKNDMLSTWVLEVRGGRRHL